MTNFFPNDWYSVWYKFGKKYYSAEELEEKNFKLGYSSSKSHYIGGKLIIAIDQDTCQPLTMLFYPGTVHDSKIFPEILHKLKKEEYCGIKNIIMVDKWFTSYKNYQLGITRYKIVLLTFPKENIDKNKILGKLSYSLDCFKHKIIINRFIKIYQEI